MSENKDVKSKPADAVENLASGLLEVYQPSLNGVDSQLNEVIVKQKQLLDLIEIESDRLHRMQHQEFRDMFTILRDYQARLSLLKNHMIVLTERSSKLKKRVLSLHNEKQKEALLREQLREAQLRSEQELIKEPKKDGWHIEQHLHRPIYASELGW